MMRLSRELRLLPVVVLAVGGLFVLKGTGLIASGGYTLTDPRAARAQDVTPTIAPAIAPAIAPVLPPGFGQPPEPAAEPEYTGAIPAPKPEQKPEQKPDPKAERKAEAPPGPPKPGQPAPQATPGTPVPIDNTGRTLVSPGERAVLESLNQRRLELEARAREIDVRENLLKAAEKRLEARMQELKAVEGNISAATQKKEEAEQQRLKNLVTMYENMKAKEAAKIFDRLDLKILVEMVSQMNPRRMGDILAVMTPDAAEKLTVELANRAAMRERAPGTDTLPKIEGRPTPLAPAAPPRS